MPTASAGSGIETVELCALPDNPNKIVYTEGIYSGVDEYWFFSPIKEKCNQDIPICLEFEEYKKLSSETNDKLQYTHANYHNTYLLIGAVGIYITGEKYGHMGSCSGKFVVKEIVSIQQKRRRK